VERHPKPVARRIRETALEIFGGRIRDRVNEEVELPAERLPRFVHDARDVLVGADFAGRDQRRVDRLRELAHALLDPLALIRERKLRATGRETARDRPRDRPFVGDAEDETALAFESGHGGRVYGFLATLRALRRFFFVPCVAALV